MSAGDELGERVAEAVFAGLLPTILTVTGRIWHEVDATTASKSFTLDVAFSLIQSLPGILTLIGLIAAFALAGPLGIFGAVLEVVGANRLFNPEVDGGIGLIIFGAFLVIVGSRIPWSKVYQELL